ncbi:ADP-ribose pyrophosphatase YjhB (NUDIX family) [Haloferula luteola]|uniref:ADP-ribose pyrophosphatase YjhB (NUDIX family) n=1 Tax=Haloferula luteola TaxID=595692 RepID=A0A840VEW0_9BACT|nr:NUDIX hydrolase N-terminal domain-containing protein [Haloferula luteola]MBB5353168.1 ADP-ribose pyrophosphatase YjhB (NUDIX family) [Haloferula luteola]
MPKDLLALSREIKGLAETGLRYSDGAFDRERYQRLHEIASELLQTQVPNFIWPVEFGYPTPKVDSRAAVIDEGKILLVRERSNGLWTLPGGWMDADHSPSENAVREVLEESGYTVRARKLVAVWDKAKHGHPAEPEYTYKLLFLCELLGGGEPPSHDHEISEIRWFAPTELPEMCPHRASPEYVAAAFRHHADLDLPTEWD